MRRLLLLGLALLLLGLAFASAAALEVEGGVLQSFRLDVVVDLPAAPPPLTDVIPSA